MMSKWRPRRSTDDERRSSLCKPRPVSACGHPGGFAVSVSANAVGCHRAPVLPAPLPTPARRPSLLGRLGCETPSRQVAPTRYDAVHLKSPCLVIAHMQPARTVYQLLCVKPV